MRRRDLLHACAGLAFGCPPAILPGAVAAVGPARAGEVVTWPEVTLLDGTRWQGPPQAGAATVVVFWSTTCPFCLRHNAHVEKLRRATQGRSLQILTVAREKDPATVRAYLQRHGYGFAVTLQADPMAQALATRKVIPLTVTVGRDGRLRQVIPGEMFEEDVMELARLD